MLKLLLSVMTIIGVCLLPYACAEELTPEEVFEARLKPIFDSPNPSSCVQCHLSAVDLKDYILPSSRDTFLSLRNQGLIDTERPSESKILTLISMGETDPEKLSRRIHAKTRESEYNAFSRWIEACCQDEKLLAEKAQPTTKAGPKLSDGIIRHARKDRVLDSFIRNVWSQRMRCFPCHTPSELDSENPLHKKPIQRHRDFVNQYGTRMNIFKESPLATMRSLLTSSRKQHDDRLPLVNLESPANSLLLLKPTAELPPKDADGTTGKPSSLAPVSHMGGIKMHKGDQSYKAWLHWLTDYATSVSGAYDSQDKLPKDNWYPTQHVIRIKGIPSSWPNLSKVQIFVHRWDTENESWEDEPVAFTQSLVTPRKIVNGSLFALAQDKAREHLNPEGTKLEPGRVQIRIYLDRDDRLAESPTCLLNDRTPDATLNFNAKFRDGFKNAEVLEGIELATKP